MQILKRGLELLTILAVVVLTYYGIWLVVKEVLSTF